MKTNHHQLCTVLFAVTALALLASDLVRAEIVFDNTSNLITSAAFSALPMGNQIRLSGTNRIVSEIDIGITRQGYPGTADFQLWFYANDGTGEQPGTLLWNSGLIDNLPLIGSSQIMAFAVPQILVPDTFTWELQISDSRGVNEMSVGQLGSSSPTIGTYVNAWFGNPGSWGNDHFQRAARVVAVPEPATVLLLGLGGLALVRRRRA